MEDVADRLMFESIKAQENGPGYAFRQAILTWRWKRQRDLKFEEDKQRPQNRIDEEFAEKRLRDEKAAYRQRLELEKADLVSSMAQPVINSRLPETGKGSRNGWARMSLEDCPEPQDCERLFLTTCEASDANVPVFAQNLSNLMSGTKLSLSD